MTCTYNADDTTNPFSSCIDGTAASSLNSKIDNYNAKLSNDLTTLYGKYKTYGDNSYGTDITIAETELQQITSGTDPVTSGYADSQTALYTANNTNLKNRGILDAKVSFLNSDKNKSNANDDTLLYNAYFYVNMLWIILATSLILYVFTELY